MLLPPDFTRLLNQNTMCHWHLVSRYMVVFRFITILIFTTSCVVLEKKSRVELNSSGGDIEMCDADKSQLNYSSKKINIHVRSTSPWTFVGPIIPFIPLRKNQIEILLASKIEIGELLKFARSISFNKNKSFVKEIIDVSDRSSFFMKKEEYENLVLLRIDRSQLNGDNMFYMSSNINDFYTSVSLSDKWRIWVYISPIDEIKFPSCPN